MDAVQTAIKDKIIVVQGRQVILDSDVAALYGVETKRVNRSDQEQPRQIPGRVHSPAYPVRMGRFAVENFDHKNPQRSAMPPKPLPKRDFICWRQS